MSASRLWFVGVTLIVLAGVCPFASAGTIRHDAADPAAYLDLAGLPEYACVGRFDMSTNWGEYMASGTLIAPDWVLTAGHVVADATSLTFSIGGSIHAASKWLAHPKWRGDLLGGYDIGLVKLGTPVADAIAPAILYAGSDELGAVGTAVGFGMTGTGETGAVIFDGQKRAGQNVIDALYGNNPRKTRLLLSDFDNPDDPADNVFGSELPLDLEYLIAPGDSGGGVFIDLGSGPILAGVHSFIGAFDEGPDADYGDISGHIRVSAFGEWIDRVLSGRGGGSKGRGKAHPKEASGLGFVGDPAFVNLPAGAGAVPEPATLSLLALGACLALLRRRRA